MKSSLVSIVIPAYNAAKLIGEALDAVLKQTHTHWEVIVVEDGTEDGTEEIIKNFAGRTHSDQFIYIRHKQNKGVSAARNTAIDIAKGKYIALLDHDDIWEENHIETLLQKLDSTSADIIFSTAKVFGSKAQRTPKIHGPSEWEWGNFPSSLLDRCYIPVSSVMMRKTLCEVVGEFDTSLMKAEDLDYWIRCIDAGMHFEFVSHSTNYYRQYNPDAATSDKAELLEWHAQVLRKHRHTKAASRYIRGCILARHHFGVMRRNLKLNRAKAAQFFLWSWSLSPLGSISAICRFSWEKLGLLER